MINKILTLLFVIGTMYTVSAQQHVCGVTHEDQMDMIAFIEAFNKRSSIEGVSRMGDPVYVPVRFHIVGKTDGTGKTRAKFVLNQMAVMIRDFKKAGMYLYLDEYSFNYINNTGIYSNASNFENTVVANKDPDAVNIFITLNADTGNGSGTVLGFYSPSGDYIIIRINDVENATASLSHELGHFFSLPHTFFGWEGIFGFYGWNNGWDVNQFNGQMNVTTVPGTNFPIEVMNGSNCNVAADRICDTPPDYNFGFQAEACAWNKELLDINGDLIIPMHDNYMGYFTLCQDYQFTQGQIDVMMANWESNARTHLRRDYIPDTTHIVSNHVISEPGPNETLTQYDNVLLDWSDAEGASHYLLSITNSNENIEIIVDESEYIATELSPNTFYFWEVEPFNDGFTDTEPVNSFFTTGSESVGTIESSLLKDVTVYPNPAQSGNNLNIDVAIETSLDMSVDLFDVTGKRIHSQAARLNAGNNTLTINTEGISQGIYLLKLETEDGTTHRKIVIN